MSDCEIDLKKLDTYVFTLVHCVDGLCKKVKELKRKLDAQEESLDVQERMIEICMELVNEQRDTIQLIKYAFED